MGETLTHKSKIDDAELALTQDPGLLARTMADAMTDFNQAVRDHAEVALDDAFQTSLDAELRGFRERLTGTPAERLLIALEAEAHFKKRLAEVAAKVAAHRQREFARSDAARRAPTLARMREDQAQALAAPVRAVLEALASAQNEADAGLSVVANEADAASIVEGLESKLKEASSALRALRHRRAA